MQQVREPLAHRENIHEDVHNLNIGMAGNLAGASTPPSKKQQSIQFDSVDVERNAQAVLHALSQEVSLA